MIPARPCRRLDSRAVAAMLCVATLATEVRADPRRCPAIAGGGPALAAIDVETRLAFIRARIRHDAFRARQVSLGFGTSFAILSTGAAIYGSAVHDRNTRAGVYTGGAGSVVGLGLLVVGPLHVIADHDMLEAHVARAGPEVDRCRLLALAESMLIRDAKNEKWNRGWFNHTGNALLGVASLLVLGLGFHQWVSGALNGVSSIAVGEVMLNLQPGGLIRDLRAYREGDLSPRRRHRRRRHRH